MTGATLVGGVSSHHACRLDAGGEPPCAAAVRPGRVVMLLLLAAAFPLGQPSSALAQPQANPAASEANRRGWPAAYGALVPLTIRGHSFLIPERFITHRPSAREPQDGFVMRFRLSDQAPRTPAMAEEFNADLMAGRAVQVLFAGSLSLDDSTWRQIERSISAVYRREIWEVFGAASGEHFGLRPTQVAPVRPSGSDFLLGDIADGRVVFVRCAQPFPPLGLGQSCMYKADWRGVPVQITTFAPLRPDWREVVETTMALLDRMAR